jgi:hypothetical protein
VIVVKKKLKKKKKNQNTPTVEHHIQDNFCFIFSMNIYTIAGCDFTFFGRFCPTIDI